LKLRSSSSACLRSAAARAGANLSNSGSSAWKA
jgi:hypothetical protein